MNRAPPDLDSSDSSFGPKKWLRPKKPVELCEPTGSFLRPRGRAPSGREWDETVGAGVFPWQVRTRLVGWGSSEYCEDWFYLVEVEYLVRPFRLLRREL